MIDRFEELPLWTALLILMLAPVMLASAALSIAAIIELIEHWIGRAVEGVKRRLEGRGKEPWKGSGGGPK